MDTAIKLFEYVIYGIVEGVTEVFPVSSSAHLALTGAFVVDTFHHRSLSFTEAIILHSGTFAAILVFYQKDVIRLWLILTRQSATILLGRAPSQDLPRGNNIPFLMIVSLVFTASVGLILRPVGQILFVVPELVSVLLLINGVVILLTSRVEIGHKSIEDLKLKDFVLIGIFQGLSIVPGISRFGLLLCAGLIRKLSWFEAVKLSFLLSLPTVFGAAVVELAGYLRYSSLQLIDIASLGLGVLISGLVGAGSIYLLLNNSLHERKKLIYFGFYCILTGVYCFCFFFFLSL